MKDDEISASVNIIFINIKEETVEIWKNYPDYDDDNWNCDNFVNKFVVHKRGAKSVFNVAEPAVAQNDCRNQVNGICKEVSNPWFVDEFSFD